MNKSNNTMDLKNSFIDKIEKEKLLNQKAIVIWFTGLSGAGKTTLAKNLGT